MPQEWRRPGRRLARHIATRVELAADGTLKRVKPVDLSFFN
ncbi:hypothetical protein [Streptomyces sp. NBC_00258]|nr:hypothetical protein [Streptomyces sp. NBC_00258]